MSSSINRYSGLTITVQWYSNIILNISIIVARFMKMNVLRRIIPLNFAIMMIVYSQSLIR